jgi:hypothetical protein
VAMGSAYDNNFVALPAEWTRGCIIIAANISLLKLSDPIATNHTISTTIHDARCPTPWQITGVYDPQGDLEKKIFLREFRQLKKRARPTWLILGDFNLICRIQDKNNNRVNMALISSFQRPIDFFQG